MKKKQGHYCRICGQRKANEKFSGKGHAAHICKACAKLPLEKRNEAEAITRIDNLPFFLSRQQRSWLEKKRKDRRENVRNAAEWAYAVRFQQTDVSCVEEDELYTDEMNDLEALKEAWETDVWRIEAGGARKMDLWDTDALPF